MKDKVRLQIPVDPGVVPPINDLAKRMEVSQARMVALLLDVALDDRRRMADWLTMRVNAVEGKGWQRNGGKPVYLQPWLEPAVRRKLENLAGNMQHVPSRFAALVLESLVDDDDWIVKAITGRLAQKLLGFGRKRRKRGREEPVGEAAG